MFHSSNSTHRSYVLFLIILFLTLYLAASPAFALYPEEADPDPDLTYQDSDSGDPQVLLLSDLADLKVHRLEAGRYLVWIFDNTGTVLAIYEIVVVR